MRQSIILMLVFSLFVSLGVIHCSSLDGIEQVKAKLKLMITETRVETLIVIKLSPLNESTNFFVVLPFIVDMKISHFPSDAICLFETVEGQYTVFSLVIPPSESKVEILVLTPKLFKISGDWNTMQVSFGYENPPPMIAQILNKPNTINYFERIEVTFPPNIDMMQVVEMPASSSSTDNTRCYEMSDIQASVKEMLSIRYSVAGSFWIYEMIFMAIIGIGPALAVHKIQPNKERKTRSLFLIPFLCVLFWTSYSTVMLLVNGPTWDYLSKYYTVTIEVLLVMGTWLRNIFGKTRTETLDKRETKSE